MKNPGCGKQPGFSSLRLREAILPNPATPERACGDDTQSKTAYGDDANPLSNRRALKFIHSYVSADISYTCRRACKNVEIRTQAGFTSRLVSSSQAVLGFASSGPSFREKTEGCPERLRKHEEGLQALWRGSVCCVRSGVRNGKNPYATTITWAMEP